MPRLRLGRIAGRLSLASNNHPHLNRAAQGKLDSVVTSGLPPRGSARALASRALLSSGSKRAKHRSEFLISNFNPRASDRLSQSVFKSLAGRSVEKVQEFPLTLDSLESTRFRPDRGPNPSM